MRPHIIQTKNKEVYIGFSNLRIMDKVVIEDLRNNKTIGRIIKNINKKGGNVKAERFNDKVILKRKGDFNFEVYLK